MREDKRTINHISNTRRNYTCSRTLFGYKISTKKIVRKPIKNVKNIYILKEDNKEHKKKYTCQRKHKKETFKNKKPKFKRKIKKAKTIPNTRLTEPKKRNLFSRIMLQSRYNRGAFDYIEKDYDDLTREELKEYQESKKRIDRRYYKQVQAYEDAYDDVTVRRGWMGFKIGLATILLCTAIGLEHHIIQDIHDSAPKEAIVITLQDASQEQISNARVEMSSLKVASGYEFKNLTPEEQIDATLRLPIVESKFDVMRFKNSLFNFKDQELLDKIVQEAFGEEYGSYSDAKKFDLRKLAYELLEQEKKDWMRDPQKLVEIKAKQEAERIEREKNRAEVEARLYGKDQAIEDDMELE